MKSFFNSDPLAITTFAGSRAVLWPFSARPRSDSTPSRAPWAARPRSSARARTGRILKWSLAPPPPHRRYLSGCETGARIGRGTTELLRRTRRASSALEIYPCPDYPDRW
ncbi:MAG: hypothetical protein ACTSQI_18440 [Candidatus Helarchaeota archaeon]